MTEIVRVYVIGSCYGEEGRNELSAEGEIANLTLIPKERYISIDDHLSLFNFFKKSNVEVHFIDPEHKISHFYTQEIKKVHEEFVKFVEKNRERVFVYPHLWEDWLPKNQHLLDGNEGEEGGGGQIVNIFLSSTRYSNPFYFPLELDLPLKPNYYFFSNADKLGDFIKATPLPNIYRANHAEMEEIFNKYYGTSNQDQRILVKDGINKIVANTNEHLRQLDKAGVSTAQPYIQRRVDSWVLNTESPYMKGIILEYRLFPKPISIPDSKACGKTIQEKFNTNAAYRKIIYDHMLYGYNNLYSYIYPTNL